MTIYFSRFHYQCDFCGHQTGKWIERHEVKDGKNIVVNRDIAPKHWHACGCMKIVLPPDWDDYDDD